jgi:RNA polymerase sigma-70 factor, ECF subfamily
MTADKALVRRMLAGDEQAFERLFDEAFPVLYRFALIRLAYREDAAEEVAQAALCQAMRKLSTYRGEAALLTWLCTFCRHEISDYVRRTGDRVQVDLDEDGPEIRAALESLHAFEQESPEARLQRSQLAERVRHILDRLPPQYGSALEWKYIDELSVREIAERLGLGVKAAESLLTRARRAFRDAFETVALGASRPDGASTES